MLYYDLKGMNVKYSKEQFNVGQKLWISDGTEVEIAKVGNKFLQLNKNAGRVFIENLAVDGGEYCSPATCYLSEQEYLNHTAYSKKFNEFANKMREVRYLKDLTIEKIEQVEKILGV